MKKEKNRFLCEEERIMDTHTPVSVENCFREFCQRIAGTNIPEGVFEGLSDFTQLPNGTPTKFVGFEDTDNGGVCIINGKYRLSNGVETAAVAIGLWNKERNCFSVFTKMKSGAGLPVPLLMKGDADEASRRAIEILVEFARFTHSHELSWVLDGYNKIVQKNQKKIL